MTSTNHWGRPLPGLDEITRDLALVDHLVAETARMLGGDGMVEREVALRVLHLAQDTDQYEARAHTLLAERRLLRPTTRDLHACWITSACAAALGAVMPSLRRPSLPTALPSITA